jgi:hypothetical protein
MRADHRPRLPRDAEIALNDVWSRTLASNGNDVDRQQLQRAARRVSISAHEAKLRPEEFVVAVKNSWSECRGEWMRSIEHKRVEGVVSEMISCCIEEFYRGVDAPHE